MVPRLPPGKDLSALNLHILLSCLENQKVAGMAQNDTSKHSNDDSGQALLQHSISLFSLTPHSTLGLAFMIIMY